MNRRHARPDGATLTRDEMARLVKACSPRCASGIRNRALIAILYRCGLRVREIIALGPGEVDRDERSIHVSGPRERVVVMDPGSFWLVEGWIEYRLQMRLGGDAPFLCTLHGAPLSASYVRGMLSRLARKAQIDKRVSAEVIRRTLAVELATEGFPVGSIQAQLGHASLKTTSRYLAHTTAEEPLRSSLQRPSWRP